jgi:hypothetical protein
MKQITFPLTVKVGTIPVKIYRVKSAASKDGFFYQVAGFTFKDGKRKLVSFSDFAEAKAEAESIASKVSSGDVAALDLRAPERAAYGRAVDLLRPSNTPLELAAARYAEAVELLGDGNRLIDAVKFFKARNPDLLPSKTVAELIDEMIKEKMAHGKSARYLGDLRNSPLQGSSSALPLQCDESVSGRLRGHDDSLGASLGHRLYEALRHW